jgi:predicted enzyme related to lactoylglutathione lyase
MRKVGWFDIYVDDMNRAQAFYEAVLETELVSLDDPNDDSIVMRTFPDDFTSHGAGGALVKLDHAGPGPGGTMVYFTCADCAVEQARVEDAGGKVVRPKHQIGEHGFVSLAVDTEGNMIGLHSMT